MESVRDLLTSPAFWIGAVIVGMLVNIVAAYLKTRLDSTFSLISHRWAERSDKSRLERAARIRFLSSSPNEQMNARFREMRNRIYAIEFFLFSVIFVASAILCEAVFEGEGYETVRTVLVLASMLVGLTASLLGLAAHREAMRVYCELMESQKAKEAEKPLDQQPASTEEHKK